MSFVEKQFAFVDGILTEYKTALSVAVQTQAELIQSLANNNLATIANQGSVFISIIFATLN